MHPHLHVQVSIQVVSDGKAAGRQELLLALTAVRFSTEHGGTVKASDRSEESYGSWFSMTRSAHGTVEAVFYPEGEELRVLAFKKAIAALLSFTLDPSAAEKSHSYTSEEVAIHGPLSFSNAVHGMRLERHATTNVGVSLYKVDSVIDFSTEGAGAVESVATNESWSTAEHPLAGLAVYGSLLSTSQLHLLKVGPSDPDPPTRPSQLRQDTLVVPPLAASELNHSISSLSESIQEQLNCLSGATAGVVRCQSKLSSLLASLSLTELKDIVHSSSSGQQGAGCIAVLQAMARTENPAVPPLFADLLSDDKLRGIILSLLPRMKAPPSANLVDHLWALAEGEEEEVAVQALFVLGALAGRHGNSQSSIVEKLHTLLQEHTGQWRPCIVNYMYMLQPRQCLACTVYHCAVSSVCEHLIAGIVLFTTHNHHHTQPPPPPPHIASCNIYLFICVYIIM